MEDLNTKRMSMCGICGRSLHDGPITALINLQTTSGTAATFAAHRDCARGILHPDARATLDDGPAVRTDAS
jgi:hypothetical protein